MGIKPPWSRDRSTVSTTLLDRRGETSSHSASHLDSSRGNGVSTEDKDKGGGLTNGREYPCLITSRTNLSEVIRCQAGRKNDSLPPTEKRPFCANSTLCILHQGRNVQKARPIHPHPPKMDWIRGGDRMGSSHQRRPAGSLLLETPCPLAH